MFKLFSAALVTGVLMSSQPVFAQGQPAKKAPGGSVTTTDIRGSGNTVIVNGTGQGSVKVLTNDQGQGNRVIVTHNGQVVLPQKVSYPGKGGTREAAPGRDAARAAVCMTSTLLRSAPVESSS